PLLSCCLHFYFFLSSYLHHQALHSFPTRRSSDLILCSINRTITIMKCSCNGIKGITASYFIYTESELRHNNVIIQRDCIHYKFTPLKYYRSEEHTSELQSRFDIVCRLLLEKKKKNHSTLMSKNR